eukprot:jgi/Phyca11/535758/estExt2_fgenesh1_pg.C_PHYCAscaffold_410056
MLERRLKALGECAKAELELRMRQWGIRDGAGAAGDEDAAAKSDRRIQLMGFGLFTDASRGQSTTCNPSRNTEPRLFVSTIISTQELLAEQQRFSAEVGAEIKKAYQRECVFNVDETAVYYEEDPASSFSSAAEASPRGSKDAAVRIERYPLAIYVDNLKCHVSETAQEAFASWGTKLVSLRKNTTAVLQPLDVGIMGPFKEKLRSLTLSYNLASIQRNGSQPLRERLLALKRMSADEKRKLLVDRVVTAWAAIDERCIRRAWEKAGL